MINIDILREAYNYRVNHTQQGSETIEQFNQKAYIASIILHNKYLGLEEQYNPQTKGAIIQYATTKKVHTALLPFREYNELPLAQGLDYIPIPDDCSYILNIRSVYYAENTDKQYKTKLSNCGCTQFGERTINNIVYKKYIKDIKFTPEDRWVNRTQSVIITSDSYCQYSDRVEFYFKKIRPTLIRLEYIKKPKMPKWAYVLVDGVPVYDAVNSINLEWGEDQLDRLIERMDNQYSRNTSDMLGINFSQSKIQRGE